MIKRVSLLMLSILMMMTVAVQSYSKEYKMKVKIASIKKNRYEDGPGIRTTIFFQGCNVKCKGCHNERIQDIRYGKEYEVRDLCEEILAYNLPVKKITVSGGEPLMQREALEEFVDEMYKKDFENKKISGEIVGGNLSIIVTTLGTDYEIDTKGKIFFIEEIEEEISRIDRMMTHLKYAGKFEDCNAVLLGNFAGCENTYGENYELMDLLKNFLIEWRH